PEPGDARPHLHLLRFVVRARADRLLGVRVRAKGAHLRRDRQHARCADAYRGGRLGSEALMFGAHAVGGPAKKAYVNLTTSARAGLTRRTTTPILGEEEPMADSVRRCSV